MSTREKDSAYAGVLQAVQSSLLGTASIGRLDAAAAAFVRSLARQGYIVEKGSRSDT